MAANRKSLCPPGASSSGRLYYPRPPQTADSSSLPERSGSPSSLWEGGEVWVCVGMGGGIETVQPCPVAEPTASSLPQSRHLLGQLSGTSLSLSLSLSLPLCPRLSLFSPFLPLSLPILSSSTAIHKSAKQLSQSWSKTFTEGIWLCPKRASSPVRAPTMAYHNIRLPLILPW